MPSAAAEAAGAAEDAEAAEDAGAAAVAAAAVAVSRRGPVASAKRPVFAQMLAPPKRGFLFYPACLVGVVDDLLTKPL